MRDFYSRRRGEARKLMIIPPTRLMLTRGGSEKKLARKLERENEVEPASNSFRNSLRADVASRRSWEVRREEASRREERNIRKGFSAPNSLVSVGKPSKVEEERRRKEEKERKREEERKKEEERPKVGHLRPSASRRLS